MKSANNGMLFLDEIGELGLDEKAMILRAIEENVLPVGSDKETVSSFQLVAGTNRDRRRAVTDGRFREDLLARLNLWTFELPGLKDRREDLEPNIEFELARHAEKEGATVTFNREARERFLGFPSSPGATWSANFRDLGASITRMATLAPRGRITEDIVVEEIERLQRFWRPASAADGDVLEDLLGEDGVANLDMFDRVQLAAVVTVCRANPSLSAAGRALFAVSRTVKSSTNDADRLKKYLARFGLGWDRIVANGR